LKTPKVNREEVRENSLTIPMTKCEKDAIRQVAERQGMSMATYARFVLNKSVKEV
jgi:predicted DNA binding CopG/RHH family protein